jgi:hypothetical protein
MPHLQIIPKLLTGTLSDVVEPMHVVFGYVTTVALLEQLAADQQSFFQ